jgi:hypothetical protein
MMYTLCRLHAIDNAPCASLSKTDSATRNLRTMAQRENIDDLLAGLTEDDANLLAQELGGQTSKREPSGERRRGCVCPDQAVPGKRKQWRPTQRTVGAVG